ncbi:MAG: hypothetical protein RH917_15415 [Lacipirellulaceae bacterium]
MPLDIESTKEAISLGASFMALASTAYFWLVRANRERAQVQVQPVGQTWGNVPMPQEDPEAYQRLTLEEGQIPATYGIDFAVVNNSSLPNALLGVKGWLQLADDSWREAYVRIWEDSETPGKLPMNLSALNTAGLQLTLTIPIIGNYDGGFQGRRETAGNALAQEHRVRLELTALQGKTFLQDMLLPADELERTSLSQAA